MSDIDVVTGALRKEATTWEDQSVEIKAAATGAEGLHLTRIRAGIFQLIFNDYEGCVDQVVARCSEGSREMIAIGDALRRNAQAYEDGDADVTARVTDAY